MAFRTSPVDSDSLPPGIPNIIGNEAAERFSFYGMKTILVVFMTEYLWLMNQQPGEALTQVEATAVFHNFSSWVYFTPFLGAFLSDLIAGKYNTIMWLSIVYCLGHAALACMGLLGDATMFLYLGLGLITLGAGGIKPCVSAHVGDQFGPRNQLKMVRVFNWFYFSINLGAFASTLATPWLLRWYGPHWAFGIPGVLMALATLLFWCGRHKFAHLPAKPEPFLRELFSRDGLFTLLKLTPLVLFVAIFWSLFDQTGSSWVFQAADMDRNFMGITWLKSQIQALNPILILTLIPLFTYVLYPAIDKVWKLTPLRKIGIGLFLTAGAYTIPVLIQSWIERGDSPSIAWQLLAYFLLTSAEIMVSIVCLEFFYTQAPRRMKSILMALFFFSVFIGNKFVENVNHFIAIPSELSKTSVSEEQKIITGFDQQAGTDDDIIANYKQQSLNNIEFQGQSSFEKAATLIEAASVDKWISRESGQQLLADFKDHFGNPLTYQVLNSKQARIYSAGADQNNKTQWDTGLIIKRNEAEQSDKQTGRQTWLEKRRIELGIAAESNTAKGPFERTYFLGGSEGMTTLEGTAYFRFFTILMLITAFLYIPFAMVYKPRDFIPK